MTPSLPFPTLWEQRHAVSCNPCLLWTPHLCWKHSQLQSVGEHPERKRLRNLTALDLNSAPNAAIRNSTIQAYWSVLLVCKNQKRSTFQVRMENHFPWNTKEMLMLGSSHFAPSRGQKYTLWLWLLQNHTKALLSLNSTHESEGSEQGWTEGDQRWQEGKRQIWCLINSFLVV
jgi:hypothetical protein